VLAQPDLTGTPLPGALTPESTTISEIPLDPASEVSPPVTEITPQPEQALDTPAVTPTVFTVSSGSAIQVNIVARQRAWMRVLVDDEVGFEGRVTPGSAYVFSGSKSIEILTGNGAALQVFYGQQDLGYLGILGEVVSRTFTVGGVQTPTPWPTSPALAQPTPTLPAGLVFPTPAVP
jgi:hypothetical protein